MFRGEKDSFMHLKSHMKKIQAFFDSKKNLTAVFSEKIKAQIEHFLLFSLKTVDFTKKLYISAIPCTTPQKDGDLTSSIMILKELGFHKAIRFALTKNHV